MALTILRPAAADGSEDLPETIPTAHDLMCRGILYRSTTGTIRKSKSMLIFRLVKALPQWLQTPDLRATPILDLICVLTPLFALRHLDSKEALVPNRGSPLAPVGRA